jgi:hypothetical protein
VARRQLVLGDGELPARRVCEHVGEHPGNCFRRRRVAEREILECRHVVAAGEELADRRSAVAPRAADLLRVRLEPLREVEVVDVAHVGLVDSHAERDRRDDDIRVPVRPPLLHVDALLVLQARVIGARGQPGRGE